MTGGPLKWIDTLIDPTVASLDVSGDPVATMGLHERLFGGSVA